MSQHIMHVRFEEKTGNILEISPTKKGKNTIPVPLSGVSGLLEGKERRRDYRVEFNSKTKELGLVNLKIQNFDGYSVNDFLYEIPEHTETTDPDISIQQDAVNTCWKIKIGSSLKRNLNKKGIELNSVLHFSITAKHDPNLLYKQLVVDFGNILNQNYAIIDFTMPFETEEHVPISVFTARVFDTYEFVRTLNE